MQVKFRLPEFSVEDAVSIAREQYGLDASATILPGERDRNFHLITKDGTGQYVLKIANTTEEEAVLDLQNRAMEFLTRVSPSVQISRLCRTLRNEDMTRISGEAGEKHFVRMLAYIPGRLLANVRPHSSSLLRSLGKTLGIVDRALLDFSHPAADRKLKWDLRQGGWIREYLAHIENPARRELVATMLDRYENAAALKVSRLRSSIIYNDANDYNILVSESPMRLEVIGLIDFGDMVRSYTIADLAVAMAYASLGKPDPLTAACDVLTGYHEELPLSEEEIDVLFSLYCLRICMTVTNAAYQRNAEPQNAYLTISESPAWQALGELSAVHPDLACSRFRFACNLPASKNGQSISTYLASCNPAALTGLNLAQQAIVVDLGIGSDVLGSMSDILNPDTFSRRISECVSQRGGAAGIGRYNEARIIGPLEAIRIEGNDGAEWRTVHLGVDIFLPPGSPVFAPLDGVVHSFADNSSLYDYGPTIVLEHDIPGASAKFYTLYGHLSPDSLNGLFAGRRLTRGQRIGSVGSSQINGGWPPHVHIQIISDMFGRTGDFIGNCSPGLREFWLQICPDANLLLRIPETKLRNDHLQADEIAKIRSQYIGRNLSLSYSEPLHIVRGFKQQLFDAEGRVYLDAVNNVAHVGHCHPRVTTAALRQMQVLNTNTRYFHENLAIYAKRLCATLPEPLRVCYFVCSGSEANELALRLAKTHTAARDFIVLESGYHGNTTSLIDVSSYKFDGPGGTGAPPWVHKVAMPDPYRGRFRRLDREAGIKYAREIADVTQQVLASGNRVAGFLCEAMPGCGGQIVFPPGYLKEAYRHVRQAGGVCIADEVQTGFGRVGSYFWAFETQGVVPDIVTVGKPIGNGHPLGAVITTPEIADAFHNGMEYFNSFGGNPVSCAIGMAVLDVIEDEKLQQHAQQVGSSLLTRLKTLMSRHSLIGDVRGSGLFLGIEFVEDRQTLQPAARQASYIINRARQRGLLLSTDGPLHNVIKIKPPLVFTESDADFLASTLDDLLQEI